MNAKKLILELERVNEINKLQVSDILKELETVILFKNVITDSILKKENYTNSEESNKNYSSLMHYKLKLIQLIITL